MKKTLLFTMALSVLAISCTKSEVVKAPGRGQEIKFDTYMGRVPVTKATSADLATLQKPTEEDGGIQVVAFIHDGIIEKIPNPNAENVLIGDPKAEIYNTEGFSDIAPYMDETLWWATDQSGWDYDGVVYWPDYHPTRKLAFISYALNAKDCIVWDDDTRPEAINEKSYTKFTFEVKENVKEQKDLLVTEFQPNLGVNMQSEVDAVSLNFKHLLSRVGFQVVANQTVPGVDITIKDIVLKGTFPRYGKVDLLGVAEIAPVSGEGATLTDEYDFFGENEYFVIPSSIEPQNIFANTSQTNPIGDGEPTTTTNQDDSNRYMMIMPSAQENASIEVTYQLTGQKLPQVATVSLPADFVFQSGISYIFRFTVSTLAISFDIIVDEWKDKVMGEEDGTNEKGEYPLAPDAGL